MLMLSMQCESSKYASYSDGQQWRQEGSARILGSPGGLKFKTENDQICVVNFFQKTPPLSNRARRGISPKLEDSPSRPMGSNSLAKFVSRLGFKSKPVGYRRKKILHDRNMNRKAENKSPPAPDFNIGWVVQKRYS